MDQNIIDKAKEMAFIDGYFHIDCTVDDIDNNHFIFYIAYTDECRAGEIEVYQFFGECLTVGYWIADKDSDRIHVRWAAPNHYK